MESESTDKIEIRKTESKSPEPKFEPVEDSKQRQQHQKQFDDSQQEVQKLSKALEDNNLLSLSIYFLDYILRAQTALFEQIHTQQGLPRIIASMSVLCALLSGLYGLTMGLDHSILQSISAAIKLPILFLLTGIICLPSLYIFNILLGQKFRFLQTVALMTMTLATTAILLASLAPIAFFFSLTTKEYNFLQLMHMAIFALGGVYGVQYLSRGCSYIAFRMKQPFNSLVLQVWIIVYALVGMQLGWRLRPFVGDPNNPFSLFRDQQKGNLYGTLWNAFTNIMGWN